MSAKIKLETISISEREKAIIPITGTFWLHLSTQIFSTQPFDSTATPPRKIKQETSNDQPQKVIKNEMPTSAAVKTPLQTPTDGYETSEEERAIGKAIAEHLMEQEVEATIKQIPKRTRVNAPFVKDCIMLEDMTSFRHVCLSCLYL